MSQRLKLTVIMGSAILLASVGTHFLAAGLGIQTKAATGYKRFGAISRPTQALILGSSLTYSGVDWTQVAGLLGAGIESWPVPGSSPAEWEQLQRRSPQAKTTFVGVSLYDLNEVSLCDYRASVVPIRQTISDLWASGSDLTFAKRMLSWYTLTRVRSIFPTAGRSDQVVFGLRDKARSVLGGAGADEDAGPGLSVAADFVPKDRVSDWSKDRLLRRMALMRSNQGKPWFSGPKHVALLRLLQQARRLGAVVVLVLPVSPPFVAELLGQSDIDGFEASLAEAMRAVPGAIWVRLDQIAPLNSSDCYFDFVHLNMQGRSIATPELLKALAGATDRP